MKVNVYAMMAMDHQVERAQAFCDGLKVHGYNDAAVIAHNTPQPCDLAVFWGMHHSTPIRNLQEKNKQPWLMMERGYLGDRFHWTSMGYGGLNGHADFVNKDCPATRWNEFYEGFMKPWHGGDYILLTGQVLQDASLKGLGVSYQNITDDIKKHTSLPIHWRKHPHKLCKSMATPKGCIVSPHGSLEDALAGARVCVTVNSNSGVDAILAGTPVINLNKGSMVWELAQHDYELIDKPPHPERQQWAKNISYTQWSPEEIADGTAWKHLKRKFK